MKLFGVQMKKLGLALLLGAYSTFVMGGLSALTAYTVLMAILAAAVLFTAFLVDSCGIQ